MERLKNKQMNISSHKAMKTVLIAFCLCAFSCYGQVGRGDSLKTKPFEEFYQIITKQFAKIDSLQHSGDYDFLENENQKVQSIINRFKDQLFNFPDSLNYDLIYLTKSADRNLVLVSWDTRTGGTMIAFTTMAIFKSFEEVKTKMLVDTTDEIMAHSYMHYNNIKTVITSGSRKIYLAWGNGQGSTLLPWQELRAFSIINGKLVEPKIFPDKTSKIFIEFDLHSFRDEQKVPTIKIKEDGKIIQVPIEEANQGFSGKYRTYVFTGKTFRLK
jgi:hypothetical protein